MQRWWVNQTIFRKVLLGALFFCLLFSECQPKTHSIIHSEVSDNPTSINFNPKRQKSQLLELSDSLEWVFHHLMDSLPAPLAGDWRYQHKEQQQSFLEYSKAYHEFKSDFEGRNSIVLQAVAPMSDLQMEILEEVRQALEVFSTKPCILNALDSNISVPDKYKRVRENTQQLQWHTSYFLYKYLPPLYTDSTLAAMAFTSVDLYPGSSWSFVFGMAHPSYGTGVWSMYRFGDPSLSTEAYDLCLKRTLKTSLHEFGHILHLPHCSAFNCCMSGSNHLKEMDSHPLYFCPICTAKLCKVLKISPIHHFASMFRWYSSKNMHTEAEFYLKCMKEWDNLINP